MMSTPEFSHADLHRLRRRKGWEKKKTAVKMRKQEILSEKEAITSVEDQTESRHEDGPRRPSKHQRKLQHRAMVATLADNHDQAVNNCLGVDQSGETWGELEWAASLLPLEVVIDLSFSDFMPNFGDFGSLRTQLLVSIPCLFFRSTF